MRADPVHLRADLGRLRLFDSAGAVLTPRPGLDEGWFAPLLAMLQRRALRRLSLYTETRGYMVTWAGAWRVWRRAMSSV